jgi:hypothetical protein
VGVPVVVGVLVTAGVGVIVPPERVLISPDGWGAGVSVGGTTASPVGVRVGVLVGVSVGGTGVAVSQFVGASVLALVVNVCVPSLGWLSIVTRTLLRYPEAPPTAGNWGME